MSTATAAAGPWNKRSLRHLLERTGEFATVVELVNSRGVITERGGSKVMQLARGLADLPGIHALSITDNPGGNAVLSADTLGFDLLSRGQDVIIHLSCKDWNRNGLQSHAWQLASEGFESILALSGDYPADGYSGRASGVFDIDSVGLLKMLSDMNQGLETRTPKGRRARMKRTDFFLGAVVNNYKRHEREVMPQYFKLAAKAAAGAAFAINQIGYNARKMDELIKYMALKGINVPVLANVYVLSGPAARYFNAGRIPGVVVSDELLAKVERHARGKDKGKGFLLEFAARQCAVARGLGYRGAYLGGHLKQEDYARILELTASFGDGDWRDFAADFRYGFPDEFHFFEADPETGLSSTEINREYEASRTPRGPARPAPQGAADLQAQPGRPRGSVRAGPPGVQGRGKAVRSRREEGGSAQAPSRRRAGGKSAGLRLPRLRRLLAAGHRLPLPGVAVRQEPAQRTLRGNPERQVRGRREGVHLGAGLRSPESLRRGGSDARAPGRLPQRHPRRDQRLGQHLPRAGPPRPELLGFVPGTAKPFP